MYDISEELDDLDHDLSDLSEELDVLDHDLSDLSEELDDLDHELSDLSEVCIFNKTPKALSRRKSNSSTIIL